MLTKFRTRTTANLSTQQYHIFYLNYSYCLFLFIVKWMCHFDTETNCFFRVVSLLKKVFFLIFDFLFSCILFLVVVSLHTHPFLTQITLRQWFAVKDASHHNIFSLFTSFPHSLTYKFYIFFAPYLFWYVFFLVCCQKPINEVTIFSIFIKNI